MEGTQEKRGYKRDPSCMDGHSTVVSRLREGDTNKCRSCSRLLAFPFHSPCFAYHHGKVKKKEYKLWVSHIPM